MSDPSSVVLHYTGKRLYPRRISLAYALAILKKIEMTGETADAKKQKKQEKRIKRALKAILPMNEGEAPIYYYEDGFYPGEEYDYASFSNDVLKRAVATVLDMGFKVNWDRVSRFLVHNNSVQQDPNAVPKPEDPMTQAMVAKMQEMYVSMNETRREAGL